MAALRSEPRRSALVISPFATAPCDAGHRRRTSQMTRLLAEAGYRVTFLLFGFEDSWAWGHDEAAMDAMRAEWGEVVVVHAGQHVARPPADGTRHALDEWWDPALEAALANIAARRCFDVVVVHNVWLSKAFDFVHPASVKVLETHDLFWKREAAFAAIGAPASFFAIDRDSELFGLARADILVTIQEGDARELLAHSDRRVVNVPFYDRGLEAAAGPPEAARLRHGAKTSFGVLASANPFNAHGVNALAAAVEAEVARSFAPVELVVGGGVGASVRSALPVKCLGPVASERAFYAAVDYAVAPVFAGTGFKIKTGDALALGGPLLAASHAAEGTALDRSLVFDTPEAMAAAMAAIALRRPDPRPAQASVHRARDALRSAADAGARNLLRAVARHKPVLVVDLHDTDIERSALKLQGWTGMARELAAARTIFILPDAIRALVGTLLPPAVRALTFAEYEVAGAELWPNRRVIDATDAGARRPSDHRDDRWSMAADTLSPPGALSELPLLHPNVLWEPAAQRLRQAWAATPAARAARFAPGLLFLRPAAGPNRLRDARFLDSADAPAVGAALMRLLCDPGAVSVVASGAAAPQVRRMARDVCAVAGIPFRGLVDGAALAPPHRPAAAARDIAARFRAAAASLTQAKDAA